MSKGFVVYKDNDGWFRWCTAANWDSTARGRGRREEIGRYPALAEARDVRHAYNMMVHGKPTPNETYNRRLETGLRFGIGKRGAHT